MRLKKLLGYLLITIISYFNTMDVAWGQQFRPPQLDYFGLDGWKTERYRDPFMPEYTEPGDNGERWQSGIAALFDLNVIEWRSARLHWDNKVYMDQTNVQPRHVGWEWSVGLQLGEKVELYRYHHSEHHMESGGDANLRFPVKDTYGAKWTLYRR